MARLVAVVTAALVWTLTSGGPARSQTAPASIVEDLVATNRILAGEGIVDAYGHVSIRHPGNPNRYLTPR